MIKQITGKVLVGINEKIAFRLVTKFGKKGVINLGKMIPLVGGIIGRGVYATSAFTIVKVPKSRCYVK